MSEMLSLKKIALALAVGGVEELAIVVLHRVVGPADRGGERGDR